MTMTENKIYVGNLSYDVTEEGLQEFFADFGEITECNLIRDRETNRIKGFAFITYANKDCVEQALTADGKELLGRPLKVNIAQAKRTGGGGGGRRGGGYGGGGNRGGNGGGNWSGDRY